MSADLSDIVGDWEFTPDSQSKNVRVIVGNDGRKKIQIRVKCGVIQWETEGRPDGKRPHGLDTMLDYCEQLLALHKAEGEVEEEFRLSEEVTRQVREELMDFYHRRVMRFQLTDYAGARDDAEHNLRLMAFIRRFVDDQEVVMSHEQYRPFVLMDRARASAMVVLESGAPPEAMGEVEHGISAIKRFYSEHSREDLIDQSQELKVLRDLKERIREQYNLPYGPAEIAESLEADMKEAVADEDYERAAEIKKRLDRLALGDQSEMLQP